MYFIDSKISIYITTNITEIFCKHLSILFHLIKYIFQTVLQYCVFICSQHGRPQRESNPYPMAVLARCKPGIILLWLTGCKPWILSVINLLNKQRLLYFHRNPLFRVSQISFSSLPSCSIQCVHGLYILSAVVHEVMCIYMPYVCMDVCGCVCV